MCGPRPAMTAFDALVTERITPRALRRCPCEHPFSSTGIPGNSSGAAPEVFLEVGPAPNSSFFRLILRFRSYLGHSVTLNPLDLDRVRVQSSFSRISLTGPNCLNLIRKGTNGSPEFFGIVHSCLRHMRFDFCSLRQLDGHQCVLAVWSARNCSRLAIAKSKSRFGQDKTDLTRCTVTIASWLMPVANREMRVRMLKELIAGG
jgi:hypothetical protein